MFFIFKLGYFAGALLLTQIEIAIFIIIATLGSYIENELNYEILGIILQVISIAFIVIASIGHLKLSFNVFKLMRRENMIEKIIEKNQNDDPFNPLKSSSGLGAILRFRLEIKYIRKIFNLQFLK